MKKNKPQSSIDFTFAFDRIVSLVAAIIMFSINSFWLVYDIVTKNTRGDFGLYAQISMAVVLLSSILLIVFYNKKLTQMGQRHLYLFFCVLVCIEVTCVNVAEAASYANLGQAQTGISLVSVCLFALVFFVFPNLVDRICLRSFIVLSLILPTVLLENEAYPFIKNLVLSICLLAIYTVFGLVIKWLGLNITKFREAEEKNHRLVVQSLTSIANTIDAKDTFTKGHSKRVAIYSRALAKELGLSEKEQEQLFLSGLVHDIGKTSIPSAILRKNGKLSGPEFEIIKTHTLEGYRILKDLEEIPYISEAAHWHHERIDGTGYPDGLKGEEISLFARVVAVADTYDAMTHNRAYRNALEPTKVISELENAKGTQLDEKICSLMLKLISEERLPKCSDTGDIIE